MNFFAASVGVSLLAVGTAGWIAALSGFSERLIQEDNLVQKQALNAVRSIALIQKQNRILDALDISCAGSAFLAPSSIAALRNTGRLIARLQDGEWHKLHARLRSARIWQLADFAATFRGHPKGCAPGRFTWEDSRILKLHSKEAGIEVAINNGAPRWRFSNPHVIRRLR